MSVDDFPVHLTRIDAAGTGIQEDTHLNAEKTTKASKQTSMDNNNNKKWQKEYFVEIKETQLKQWHKSCKIKLMKRSTLLFQYKSIDLWSNIYVW